VKRNGNIVVVACSVERRLRFSTASASRSICRGPQAGFTYVLVLFLVALVGLGLASVATVYTTLAKRERENQLLFVGQQFRDALESYAAQTPQGSVPFPKSLEELLRDPRYPVVKRHLRKLYVDPMTGTTDWGFERNAAGGIVGVFSTARGAPLRQELPQQLALNSAAGSYAEWVFRPRSAALVPAVGAPSAGPVSMPRRNSIGLPIGGPTATDPAKIRPECDDMHQQDMTQCQYVENRLGDGRATTCQSSAQARLSACNRGVSIPVLVTGLTPGGDVREGQQ
jgi:type II secretory pathway pseudopilin PulG